MGVASANAATWSNSGSGPALARMAASRSAISRRCSRSTACATTRGATHGGLTAWDHLINELDKVVGKAYRDLPAHPTTVRLWDASCNQTLCCQLAAIH